MTNWLRPKITYYAQISEDLQNLKTDLLKKSPAKSGKIRAQYCRNTEIRLTDAELQSFAILQQQLIKKSILHYHNPKRQIYINVNGFKKYGFGIHIYYVRDNPVTHFFQSADIQTILYLSKILNNAEKKY